MAKQEMNPINIIGLKKSITDENTGVPADFHVMSALSVDFNNKFCIVTLSSYFNQQLFDHGKAPLGSVSLQLHDVPPRGADWGDWAYQQLATPIAEDAKDAYGNPLLPNQFTGAILVQPTEQNHD